MQCLKCGAQLQSGAHYCSACGTAISFSGTMENYAGDLSYIKATRYAGFWRRFGALVIDSLLLSLLNGVCIGVFALVIGATFVTGGAVAVPIGVMMTMSAILLTLSMSWLYFTLMESSSKQATLGKMALGMVVTDTDGNRISLLRANARYWSKILSGLFLCFGYVMAAFTQRKQALHDLIANTLVVDN